MNDFDNSVDLIDEDDNAGNRIEGGSARLALEFIVKSIVDDPESVVVESEDTSGGVMLRVHVAADDKGKVIGKRGRVAMSLRTLIRAVGSRDDMNISVDIAD